LRHDHPIVGIAFQPPDRFLVELAERNQIDTATAATWTRAVCAALAVELPSGVLATVAAEVPALVRAFFPEGECLAPSLPERAHRYDGVPPLWSAIERPVPSYLMFESGVPLPEETHVPTHGPVALV
jgi:hypothetical protein